MNCPKCQKGNLTLVEFKKRQIKGYTCDVCQTVWFMNELITETSGHALSSYIDEHDITYGIDLLDEKDYDHQVFTDKNRI